MPTQRVIWLDALKGMLMLLVILGHAIQTELGPECEESHFWNLIYSFHMPAFMAVSGWLFYKPPDRSKPNNCRKRFFKSCVRRAYQILWPYLIWSLLAFLIRGVYTSERFFNIVYLPDSYFWFLWVLFGICVIFSGVTAVSSKIGLNENLLILVVCAVLLGVMVTLDLRVFGFQFLAYYFLFYTLGYLLHKYKSNFTKLRHPIFLFLIFCLWLALAWGWTMHGLPSWMPTILLLPSSLIQYAYRGFTALLAVIILLSTAPIIMNGNNRLNRIICVVGDVSLGIYVVHMIIIGYIKDGVSVLNCVNWINIVIIFLIATISSIIIVYLLRKNKHTARFLLGKF